MPDRSRPAGKFNDMRYVFVICRKHLNNTDMRERKKEPGSKSKFSAHLKYRTPSSDCNKKAELNFLILRHLSALIFHPE